MIIKNGDDEVRVHFVLNTIQLVMMHQQLLRQQRQQGRPVVTPSPDEEDTPAASDCTIVSERGYPLDTTLPNLDHVPQTPPSPGSRRAGAAFPPMPPRPRAFFCIQEPPQVASLAAPTH